MSRLLALTRRELMAYFFAPVPYLVMFFFLLLTFVFFQMQMLRMGQQFYVSYQPVFENLGSVLLFLIPLLTMNSVAEERSRNTLETLLTAPVTDLQVIFAKWCGTFLFYVVMLVPTLVYLAILVHLGAGIGKPDPGPVFASYLGALLLGGLYISIGIFASSVTENALLSAFVAFFAMIALMLFQVLPIVQDSAPDWLRTGAEYLSQHQHFAEFLKGRIAVHDVAYFVTTTALFLFLAVRALESRKWR